MELNFKSQYRQFILQKINSISVEDRLIKSHQIGLQLKQLLNERSGPWGAFKSLATEPMIQWLDLSTDIDWKFVKTEGSELNFELPANLLKGVIVPALGFHRTSGARLGRGKGYYDKTFSKSSIIKIGIAYDFAVNDEVPYESHDLKMDFIITENKILSYEKMDHKELTTWK